MKPIINSSMLFTGLAIFSMFFGAGNLIFAVNLGVQYGSQTWIALIGFLITAVLLPVIGIISSLLFNANYKTFYGRLGKNTGFLLSFICFLVIAPLVAMPRIVTLTHTMLHIYFPKLSLPIFSIIFFINYIIETKFFFYLYINFINTLV